MIEMVPVYVWAAMQFVVAAGAGLLAALLTRAHLAVALARQQQSLAEARALLATQHQAMEARLKAGEEAARREALEEFLADVRVEQRQFQAGRYGLIVAERVCFRNFPLTPWIEHEVPAMASLAAAPAERARGPRLITSPTPAS